MESSVNKLSSRSHPGRNAIVALLDDVSVTFDGYRTSALSRVSLDVQAGEIFGLVGPVGSGKSTALKLLAGRLHPMSGKVKVFGRSPQRRRVKARIGYLPENEDERKLHNSNGILSLLRNLLPWKTQSVDRALSKMSREIALQRVVLTNPELLVLDEPFSSLDPAARCTIKELFLSLRQRGKTIILSSASVVEAKDLCDRIAIFYDGQIQAIGTLNELLSVANSIRFLAAVLPEETRKKILKMIRDEVTDNATPAKFNNAQREHIVSANLKPEAETPTAMRTADTILAPLLKKSTPESPSDPSQRARGRGIEQKETEARK